MVKPSDLTLIHAHQSNISALYQDFEIELPPSLLLQIMSSYELKAADVIGDYAFNSELFNQLIKTPPFNEKNSGQEDLLDNSLGVIHNWPKQLSWPQFNHYINNLLLAWLNDYKSNASLDAAFLLARCLTLRSPKTKESPDTKQGSAESSKFQFLLMHLLARSTNQFDQYKFNFTQNFDIETGLPNQQLMLNILKQRLHIDHKKTHQSLILILVNLNINFDEVSQLNATSSNLVLAAIQTIQHHLNDDATLFRVGPVELAILIEQLNFVAQVNLIASKLMHAFESALPIENITLILKPYFGCVSSLKTRSNAISLYDCARMALHNAMINNYQIEIYDQHITASFSNMHQLDEAIIDALQQNELEVFLQPIVSLPYETCTTEKCISAELLLRWQSEKWPSISAVRLVDTIYKKGFGKLFIRWLINNACRLCAELMSSHQRRVSLTINLSGTDLIDEDLPELLLQSIKLWEVPAENLVIEITENDILMDEVKVAQVIDKIVLLGFKLALDDFGTGYSSMARLRNMPINLVKIDQSFVRNIATSSQDREIVLSVLKLAHSLGKEVVAEGVEDLACLKILKEMRCEKIQGYYYAKPMPFDEFVSWLNLFETQLRLT